MVSFLNLSQRKLKKLQRVFSVFSIFSLIFQISSGIFLYQPVYSQGATPTPEPTVTIEPTPIPTETPAITSSPEPEITPEVSPTPDVSPTPEITVEPSATPKLTNSPQPSEAPKPETTSPANQPQAPPEETASSTPQVNGDQTQATTSPEPTTTPEPKENGHLAAIILEDTKAASINKLDLDFQTEGSAKIVTDKLDYAPTDTVLITGSGFVPNKTYTLVINSQDLPPVNFETKVTADDKGNLFYSYQLDGTYRPNYKAEIKDGDRIVAATTFTDTPVNGGSGSIWTTDGSCGIEQQDVNHYPKGHHVYINGSGFNRNTSYGWNIEGKPGGASCDPNQIVASGSRQTDGNGGFCFDAYTVANDDCGEYGVNFGNKKDNYRVGPDQQLCGNGVLDSGEQCDFGERNGGQSACTTGCQWVTSNPVCANQAEPINSTERVNLDGTNDGANNRSGWQPANHNGYYGGWDGAADLGMVVGPTGCANDNSASFQVGSAGKKITSLTVRSYDGSSGTDSYDVFINDVFLAHYADNGLGQESPDYWQSQVFPVPGSDGTGVVGPVTVKLVSTDNPWTYCEGWGQVTIHWSEVSQYECPAVCGNGIIETGEQCDYGRANNGQTGFLCDSLCQLNEPVPSCQVGTPTNARVIDRIDLGDSTSETAHSASGWGADPGTGNYGGRDGGETFSLIVEKEKCDDSGRDASFVLHAGTKIVNKLKIRALDGLSNNDSYDIYVNDNKVVQYIDVSDSQEKWNTIEVAVPNLSGDINVRLHAVNAIWAQCSTYGQIAVNWVEASGFECPAFCGDGFKNDNEQCDGQDLGEADQNINFCTNTCKLVPIYDGGHSCSQGTTPIKINDYSISSKEASGINFGLSGGQEYLFKVFGTYIYDKNNSGKYADAAYGTNNNWSSTRSDIGIWGTNRGVTSIVGDLGNGIGVIEWDDNTNANGDHVYQKAYTPTNNITAQFLISDWYSNWYNNSCNGQNCMSDNDGSLNLEVYECQNYGSITVDKVTDPSGDPQSFDFSLNKDGQTFDNFSLTDLDKPYSNTSLLPGTYSLGEFIPDGWVNSSWSCLQNGNQVLDNLEIVVNPGDQISCVFENTKLGSIWGRKFRDTNANGERDGSSDPYLNDWTINLYDDGWGWVKGMQTGDDSTEAGEMKKGQYKFINLTPGNYYVCEELKEGWIQTKPSEGSVYEDGDEGPFCYAVELSAGVTEKGLTFGNFKLGKVQGMKYEDLDGDGLPHENGEAYLNDWTFRLYQDWNSEPIEVTTSNTGQTGQYKYTDLSLGTYQVCEVLQEGWTQTWPKVGDVPVADNGTLHSEYGQAVANQSEAQDEASVCWQTIIDSSGDFNQLLRFGNTNYGSISGLKYEDIDGSGSQGENERGLAGWTIQLKDTEGTILATTTTATESGTYTFKNVISGTYQVCEEPQDGWQGTQPAESNCQQATVSPGQDTPNIDFGNFKLGEVSGWKWDDYNGNGFWDEGEPALSGWEICLSLSEEPTFRITKLDNGNCVQTDDNGHFEFTGLRAGNYRLSETTQPGWDQTWPVDPNYYDLTINSGSSYGGEECNGQPRGDEFVTDLVRQPFCTNFGNELQPITLTLSKINNVLGSMGPGGIVTYTLTVTNTSKIIAHDVSVRDTLPVGFGYVASSTTGASEPTVTGQNLVWSLGNLDPDAVVTITYQAKTDSSLQEGKYPNVALAWGNNRILNAADNYKTYTDPAWSWVNLIPGISLSTGIGGTIQQVLGASTETGKVLGAATGAETGWLILAILMILAGLALKNLGKLRKLIKMMILVAPLLFFLSFAKPAQAANLTVQITTLPEYKNTPVFKLSYTALQTKGEPIQAQFYYHKEGGPELAFGSLLNGETGSIETTTAIVNEQGKYYFKVAATGGGESASSETSTTVDWSNPKTPTNYRKDRAGANAFKIFWKNPDSSDFYKVFIYRSDKRDFTADNGTKIGERGGVPNEDMNYLDNSIPWSGETYYALRAIDKAGNASDLVGDGGSITYVEVSPSPGTQSAGETQPLPVAGGVAGGEVLGQGTEGSPAAGAEPQAGTQPSGTSTGATNGILGGGSKLIWVLGGLGLLALAFYFFSRRSS